MEPVLTLDAALSAARGRDVLASIPAGVFVVVRQAMPDGAPGWQWFVLPLERARLLLAQAGDDEMVADALGVRDRRPLTTREVSDLSVRSGQWQGLVLDGGRPVGFVPAGGKGATRGGLFTRPGRRRPPWAPPSTSEPPVLIEAFPRVDLPQEVRPGERFTVVIGLAAQSQAVGGPQERVRFAAPDPTVDLVVQVVADRFDAPEGIRRTLTVARDDPHGATVQIPLVAPAAGSFPWRGMVEVEYSVSGVPVGRAWRELVVSRAASPTAPPATVGGSALSPVGAPPADLTVTVLEGADPARLVWTFITPHDVPLPEGQVVSTLPVASAQSFALGQIKDLSTVDGTSVADNRIRGISRAVCGATPVEFWEVLCAVWTQVKAQGRLPSLLLISSDVYVPWELASVDPDWVVDRSLIDTGAPAVLGAQVRMGRWLPAGPRTPSGIHRPAIPPATAIDVKRMALVIGDYKSETGIRPLPQAIAEGQTLAKAYPCVWVKGTLDEVDRLLDADLTDQGKPVSVDVVHVACHGEVDLENPALNGIVLSDSAIRMDAAIVRGSELGRVMAPLVFLNACQLAQSTGDLLCDYGGLAGAFLIEGCRGFLAPLWSVDDTQAHDLAIEFYRLALEDGVEIGEVLRRLRLLFATSDGHARTTPLAYVFYGHPELHLTLSA